MPVEVHISVLSEIGISCFDDLMFESIVPSLCPEECVVEPDGECPHGYVSVVAKLGIV